MGSTAAQRLVSLRRLCLSILLAALTALTVSPAFAQDVLFMMVTSKDQSNVVEWLNPSDPHGFTRIIGRLTDFATAPGQSDPEIIVRIDSFGSPDTRASFTHNLAHERRQSVLHRFRAQWGGFQPGHWPAHDRAPNQRGTRIVKTSILARGSLKALKSDTGSYQVERAVQA